MPEMYSISFVARLAFNQRLQRTFELAVRISLNNKLIIYYICIFKLITITVCLDLVAPFLLFLN